VDPLTPQTPRPANRLPRWQRLSLDIVAAVLVVTGIVWLAVHYSIGAGAGGLPHPVEAWCIRLHGLAAFGGLFLLGALAAAHVPQGWRLSLRRGWDRQRLTGTLLCALGALLALTGYLLYYFAPEEVRPALGWVHAVVGMAMALLVFGHRRAASG
jgi:hypothetical protein